MKPTTSSVIILIAINVVMFVLINSLGLIPQEIFALYFPQNSNFGIWQFVSYLFLHGSFAHILFNMYALWAFGSVLEQNWGKKKFLIFYFISGVGAAVVYTLVNYYQFEVIYEQLVKLGLDAGDIQAILNSGSVNANLLNSISETKLQAFFSIYYSPAVGASGAIYGILIAFAITYPNIKLALIFLPIPIYAKYFVPTIIAIDLFFGLTKYSVGNIAHFAHIGGALFGLLVMLWWRHEKPPQYF